MAFLKRAKKVKYLNRSITIGETEKNIFTGTFVQILSLDIPKLFRLSEGREKKGPISSFYNASVIILMTSILDNKKDFHRLKREKDERQRGRSR